MKRIFGRKQTVITAEILRRMEARLQASRKNLVSRTRAIMQQSFLKKPQDYFFAIAQLHVYARTFTHTKEVFMINVLCSVAYDANFKAKAVRLNTSTVHINIPAT